MNKKDSSSMMNMSKVGNYTKDAVKQFEENIVNKHNYLEEVNENLSKTHSNFK